MPLERIFDVSDPTREIKQKTWDDFVRYYNFIKGAGSSINYPAKWYKVQGIVSPTQIIAWRKIVELIGEDVFNKVPLALNNNLAEENLFFLNEYKNYFPDFTNLKITLACGYFWKFVKGGERRSTMRDFYINKVKNGCEVNIYTRDKDLKKYFFQDNSSVKPYIKSLPFRMDVHYTIIQSKNEESKDNTLLFIELPHTENTIYRLEAHFTIGQLKKWGCSEKNVDKLLSFLESQRNLISHILFKRIPKMFNKAINWR